MCHNVRYAKSAWVPGARTASVGRCSSGAAAGPSRRKGTHGGNRHYSRRAGQGARSVRFGRQAAARGHRPHLGLRLHSGRRDPLQGPGAHPALQVLVRSARRRRGEPPHLHRRGRPARGVPALRRLSARSLHASEEGRHVPRRVHRARVSGWQRPEGVQPRGHRLRHRAAPRPRELLEAARAPSSPPPPRPRLATTTRTSPSSALRKSSGKRMPRPCATWR